jgi:phosphate transport system permease protein
MTDTWTPTAPSPVRPIDVTSEAALRRIRARYGAERRFKTYGLIAISITVLFLAVVLLDVLIKGLPAFRQHQLVVETALTEAEIDPQGTRDPDVLRAANYAKLGRDALRARFPEVTDRRDRKLLDGLLSSGAIDVLRERVVADPSLVGSAVKVPLLLSDDADLYLKGQGTSIETHATRGIATPSATTGEITILSSSNDFTDELVAIKRAIAAEADRLSRDETRFSGALAQAREAIAALEQRSAAAASAGSTAEATALRNEAAARRNDETSLAQTVTQLQSRIAALKARFERPAQVETLDEKLPSMLVRINGGLVKLTSFDSAAAKGVVLLPLSSTADAGPGAWEVVSYSTPESNRRVSDREVAWLERLREEGRIESAFNWRFFTAADSREPELAGIKGAMIGSALTLLVTLLLCLPIGVAAAVYLEEFAPKNRLTDLIEVNINNLAAVPSIVFGLLGLAVFLNFFGLPRSAPLVGGLVLALLVLPTIIIASRAALKAVPPSIKEAALGVGASHQQAIFHHVLPLAMPGIMTGTIIGMAHALGETAPLLMIGMVAFIVQPPEGFLEAATALPVQIYLWSDLPEAAFQAKTAAAIIVLLLFLFLMNGTAILLRRRFERRW